MKRFLYLLAIVASFAFAGRPTNAAFDSNLINFSNNGYLSTFGRCGFNRISVAQQLVFTVDVSPISVPVRVWKYGSPSDDLDFSIYKGGATPEAGQYLTHFYLYNSEIPSSDSGRQTLRLGLGVLPAGTYWLKISRTGSCSETDHFVVANGTYSAGMEAKQYISGSWQSFSPAMELDMAVVGSATFSDFASYASSTYGFIDPDMGTAGNALIDIAKWLFVPSQGVTDMIYAERDDMLTRIPFGWLAQASSTFGLINGGATSSPIVFPIDAHPDWGVPTSTITIYDPSQIPSQLDPIFLWIRTTDATILGGLTLWWLVNKARNFHP